MLCMGLLIVELWSQLYLFNFFLSGLFTTTDVCLNLLNGVWIQFHTLGRSSRYGLGMTCLISSLYLMIVLCIRWEEFALWNFISHARCDCDYNALSILLRGDAEHYLQYLILLNFNYIYLWLGYPYLFVLCVCCVCDDRMTHVLYRSRWYCRSLWCGVDWREKGVNSRFMFFFYY